jgi:hypothetical protein
VVGCPRLLATFRLIARHPDGAVFEYIETGESG